jgi:glycogen synthase
MGPLFLKAVAGQADEDEQTRFAVLWQSHVARVLLQHADDPDLVQVSEWETASGRQWRKRRLGTP